MPALEPIVKFIVREMSDQVLRRDGGHAELTEVTDDGVAIVRFDKGHNEECVECVMSEEDFGAMLLERIQWKVPQVRGIRLTTASSV